MSKYKALIGLEMHCEITNTNSKVFSSSKNSYEEKPNININEVDIAFPGVLPVVNKEAVKKALMMSMILKCKIPTLLMFERKNYYYPDLPKGYQITQETKPIPIGIEGSFEYNVEDKIKRVRINNIHLEEDSASLTHYDDYSLINYNRAGVPLLELVTYPDFNTAQEAVSFLENIRNIYRYTNISEADSKKGQIRCDVNVSIMDKDLDSLDEKNWGVKVEIKNVNSFSAVRDTIDYEIKRQIEAKENNTYEKEIKQETRRWSEEEQKTIFMRSKVDAIDYKYFVEPNIPKYKITTELLEEIRKNIPLLPNERYKKYTEDYKISKKDALTLIKEKEISDFYDECIKLNTDKIEASNWITTRLLGYLNKNFKNINEVYLTPKMLNELINLVKEEKISTQQAKEIFTLILEEEKDIKDIIKEKGFEQIKDEKEILKLIDKVLKENQKQLTMYKSGKTNLFGYFVGQILKESNGKANPSIVSKLLKSKIEKI